MALAVSGAIMYHLWQLVTSPELYILYLQEAQSPYSPWVERLIFLGLTLLAIWVIIIRTPGEGEI